MMKHLRKTIRSILLALVVMTSVHVLAQATVYTLADEQSARHCISEASGVRTDDCRVITWISMQRAAARHMTVEQYMQTHHRRHLQSETRPWMAHMSRDLSCPEGWPGGCTAWDQRGRPAWQEVLSLVHRVHENDLGHGCSETPVDWAGREVDCEELQERLFGDWHEVQCGTTVNMIITRGHREPVPNLDCARLHAEAAARREARRHPQRTTTPAAPTPVPPVLPVEENTQTNDRED